MDSITITYPDNLDTYCFEVTKRNGYNDEIIWSEQVDTLEEALSEISKHEFHRSTPYNEEQDHA